MVLTKKRPHVAIQDGKLGSAPFTTVDALDAPGRSGRFLGTPHEDSTLTSIFLPMIHHDTLLRAL